MLNLGLSNTNNTPTMLSEICRLAAVTIRVAVPIRAVDFKRNPWSHQEKVHAVASNRCFLGVGNPKSIEHASGLLFKKVLSTKSAIARETAELPIRVARKNANLLAARSTYQVHRRAAAFLTAIVSIQACFRHEYLPATLTGCVFGLLELAFSAAHIVAVGNGCVHDKRLSALSTDLLRCRGCRQSAGRRAIDLATSGPCGHKIELLAAMWTGLVFASSLAQGRCRLHRVRLHWHWHTSNDLIGAYYSTVGVI